MPLRRRRSTPPPGWSTSSDPRAWSPAAPPRRRARSATLLPWLVVGLVVAVCAARWLPQLGTSGVPWLSTLPPASARDYPRPGVDEADERLAPVVTVVEPGTSYAFQQTRTAPDGSVVPVGWSPCRPVHVVVDAAGAPADFPAQVQVVLAEVAAATGLTFVDDGLVSELAVPDRDPFQPDVYGDRWAPVLVRFTDDAAVPDLAGDVAGVAAVQAVGDPVSGRPSFVTGAVYLDRTLLDGVDPAGAWESYLPVLRHEVGHLVGLGHVDDPSQMMNPVTGVLTFQQGDLTGLAALGRAPCAPGL